MIQITITLHDSSWLSSNQRLHWAKKARRTKAIRGLAAWEARKVAPAEPIQQAHVLATIHYPTNRRIDPANAYPSVKACLDGITDAGVFPDDSAKHVLGPDMRLGEKTGTKGLYRIVFTITPTNGAYGDRNSAGVQFPTNGIPTQPSPGSATISGIREEGQQ